MSEKIEPGCLAALLSAEDAAIMGEIVRVIESMAPADVQRLLLVKTQHCFSCALHAAQFAAQFGFNDHWLCEADAGTNRAIIHESLLRRLPPPDLKQITEPQEREVSA